MDSFEWDPIKDALNQFKHGVSFLEAQYVFADPKRVISEDIGHSAGERRFTAWVASAREFRPSVSRGATGSFASLARVIGARVNASMMQQNQIRQ
jgi:uncharacterized DUF497 family protein